MGFRFQRRLKILPGISLNISKSGISTSIGTRGAKVTLGHGKVRTTVGIPGTGISYTDVESTNSRERDTLDAASTRSLLVGIGFIAGLFFLAWIISRF
jgi:hypothetical protein